MRDDCDHKVSGQIIACQWNRSYGEDKWENENYDNYHSIFDHKIRDIDQDMSIFISALCNGEEWAVIFFTVVE